MPSKIVAKKDNLNKFTEGYWFDLVTKTSELYGLTITKEELLQLRDACNEALGEGAVCPDTSKMLSDKPLIPDENLPSVSGLFNRTFGDFERGARVLLMEEQEKANPDNSLISTLCDAVRITREHVYMEEIHKIPIPCHCQTPTPEEPEGWILNRLGNVL